MTEERMIRLPGLAGKWRFSLKGMNLEYTDDRFEREVTPELAPPKDWQEQMHDLEMRNARLSKFIMDKLGEQLDADIAVLIQGGK